MNPTRIPSLSDLNFVTRLFRDRLAAVSTFLFVGCVASFPGAPETATHLRQPVPDVPYTPEVRAEIATEKPVTAVAVFEGVVYAVAGDAAKVLRTVIWPDAAGAPKSVKRLRSLGGALWAAAGMARIVSPTANRRVSAKRH